MIHTQTDEARHSEDRWHQAGSILELTAQTMAFGGRAIARLDRFVFFVAGALPGEQVRARVERVRRDHGFAQTIDVLSASPEREDPPCPVSPRCGGCDFLHWRYEAQCTAKTQWVRNALRRFPEIAEAVPAIEPADPSLGVRNRMAFSIVPDDNRGVIIGLHERGSREQVIPADTCLLPPRPMMEACASLTRFLQRQKTLPRRVDLRFSRHTNQCMANLHMDAPLSYGEELAAALRSACDHLFVTVGPEGRGHRVRRERRRLLGSGAFLERLGTLDFEIGPDTFFQTNTAQAESLVRYVRALADQRHAHRILDLYAGVGAIALNLATPERSILGLEAWEPAVKKARRNAVRNGIESVVFLGASVESMPVNSRELVPDLIVMDPPREGLSRAARRAILALAAPALIYISCNPATLARDLDTLASGGYRVVSARGFDLFPQTAHVECVVELVAHRPFPP